MRVGARRPGSCSARRSCAGSPIASIGVYVLGFIWEIGDYNADFLSRTMMGAGVETTREAFGLLIARSSPPTCCGPTGGRAARPGGRLMIDAGRAADPRRPRRPGDRDRPQAGGAPRGALHRALSVVLADPDGRLLLQKRHVRKYHSGGLWTNTCCSHPRPGEAVADAAGRRLGRGDGHGLRAERLFRSTIGRSWTTA